jgi:hypothetical protein
MSLYCSMPSCFARVVALTTLTAFAQAEAPLPKLISPLHPVAFRPEPGLPMQEPATDIGLHIVVLEGNNAVNVIKKKAAIKPVVELRDRTNMPVAGASITFTAPADGPSAIFLNGSRSETFVTGPSGQATVSTMKPVGTGVFKLTVSASFQGEVATAAVTQTNVLTSADAAKLGSSGAPVAATPSAGGLSTRAVVGIVAGVAAAAAVGIGVGLSSKNSSSSSTSVTPGSPTVGAPH